jgi:hypothetical protein
VKVKSPTCALAAVLFDKNQHCHCRHADLFIRIFR